MPNPGLGGRTQRHGAGQVVDLRNKIKHLFFFYQKKNCNWNCMIYFLKKKHSGPHP